MTGVSQVLASEGADSKHGSLLGYRAVQSHSHELLLMVTVPFVLFGLLSFRRAFRVASAPTSSRVNPKAQCMSSRPLVCVKALLKRLRRISAIAKRVFGSLSSMLTRQRVNSRLLKNRACRSHRHQRAIAHRHATCTRCLDCWQHDDVAEIRGCRSS